MGIKSRRITQNMRQISKHLMRHFYIHTNNQSDNDFVAWNCQTGDMIRKDCEKVGSRTRRVIN